VLFARSSRTEMYYFLKIWSWMLLMYNFAVKGIHIFIYVVLIFIHVHVLCVFKKM
jgi:hypothetical protein